LEDEYEEVMKLIFFGLKDLKYNKRDGPGFDALS